MAHHVIKKVLVWDLSLRIFHWAFAGSVLGALGIPLVCDKHGPWFRWHILLGLIAGFLLVLRLVMGVVGSRYARFARWPIGPVAVGGYFQGILAGSAPRHVGHNPGSALAALAMFLLVPALLATGWVAGREPWEDLHAGLAYWLMAVIGGHLLGIAWHTIRQRENIAVTMISGRQAGRPEDGLRSAQPVWAVVGVIATAAWIGGLLSNYDAAGVKLRLPLTGTFVPLGESDERTNPRVKEKRKHREHHN